MNTTEMMIQNQEEQARELAKIRKLLEGRREPSEPTLAQRIATVASRTGDVLLTLGLVGLGLSTIAAAETTFHESTGITLAGIGIVQGYLAGIRWKLEGRR